MLWSLSGSTGARTRDDLRAGLSCDGMLETAGGDLKVVFAAVLSADKAAMSWIGGVVRPGFRGSHILELLVRSFQRIVSTSPWRRTVSVRCCLSFQLIDTGLH